MTQTKIPVDLILKRLAESTEQTKSRVQKASEVLMGPLNTDLATTPYEVVYQEDRVKLKYYKPKEIKHKIPLLIVYALINRETMLDLQPGRSVVQNFLDSGMELYMIDWGYPSRKDQFCSIDDHVNGYIDNVVNFILDRCKLPKINLMGICMGGAFCVMYSSLHPEKVKNLVTTVTPTNFDTDKGLLHLWMKYACAEFLGDTYGNMPADIMNLGFLLLNPARLILDKYVGFIENMDDRNFVENFIRMEKWIFDSPDIPAATFKQFIEDCYKKNLLIQSKLELNGKRVDLKNITMPILNFYGKFDHLVPPEACELLTKHVGSKDTEDICLNTGHIGIYVSSKCQKEFSPKIVKWLKEREGEPTAAAEVKTELTAKAVDSIKKAMDSAKKAADAIEKSSELSPEKISKPIEKKPPRMIVKSQKSEASKIAKKVASKTAKTASSRKKTAKSTKSVSSQIN